jgi:hypothetical protein
MINFIKNSKERFKNKKKEASLVLLLIVGVFVACQGAQEDGNNPFGPSTSTIRIIPGSTTVLQGANFTFTTLGGSAPFTWTSSNIVVGTIIVDTGVFTGAAVAGTVTITVVDAAGNTTTATATVSPLTLGFDLPGVSQAAATTASPAVTANANQSGAGLTATIANNNTSSTFTALPTLAILLDAITVTSPATVPNGTQGDQVFTVSVTDAGNNNTGTFIYTLINDGT